MAVQENLTRQAPLSRSPNTQWLFLDFPLCRYRHNAKHRRVPLHGSAVAALGRYAELRDRFCARPKDPSFFVSTRGTRLLYVCVNQVFRKLVEEIGLTAQPRAGRPRIHDLRHGFATAGVQDFHQSGADPQGKLPVLSAYLGHADPAYTYIYLHACPELLGLAAKRLERFEEGRR